ncbi:hypothetical protein CHS0354_008854 [Potamilus streckersoni]|uniref:Uncharacterized protein n=1 Tax=Potamilus streckersoni TaxID=2493646 RepID=A0AAE0VYV5_9BIVA|nr:hypothetical protein CHS0354_008854 [Potamilus streckersoni]
MLRFCPTRRREKSGILSMQLWSTRSKISEDKDQTSMEGDTARALVDGATNYRRKQNDSSTQKKGSCTTRLLLGLTIFFFLTTVGTLAVFLWRELVYHRPTEPLKDKVLAKFPGYFRTTEEQKLFEGNFSDLNTGQPVMVNQSIYDYGYTSCSINCRQNFRRKRQTYAPGSIFHGCCVSNTYFASPETKMNIFGVMKTIVHYVNVRQYFQATNCSSVIGCTGCRCTQDRSVQTAVVFKAGVTTPDDIEDFETNFFYFDGCCTCRNT